jgi:hypothetical protein
VLGSFIGPAKENLDLTEIVMGDREIGINGNRPFGSGQGLI